jgi:hypothetical protein
MDASKRRNLMWVFVLFGVSLLAIAVRADDTGCYVFAPERSTIAQTGGFAGVDWTYSVEGQFCLIVDPNAGSASFARVDANAIDVTEPMRTIDPNAVFNLTGLVGTVGEDGIELTGQASDGSTVGLTLTFTDDTVQLTGETTPPPNSADFFVFSIDAVAARKYAGGTGDPNTPYQIATAEQMNAIGTHPEDWDKHFQLTTDIDLSPFDGKDGRPAFNIIAPNTNSLALSFQGTPFTGVFDGDGHTIASLNWSGPETDYVGLFGCISGTDAEIRNLGLIDPNIEAFDSPYVGALVGYLRQGTLHDCFAQGGAVFGVYYVGGLVGSNGSGTIARCHTDGDVTGSSCVGGLAGDSCANIEQSYSASDVRGDRFVGGLVGFNHAIYTRSGVTTSGTIRDCYATGRVSGDQSVGGLAGYMWGGSATRSYATGSVSGGFISVGGLVGYSPGDNVTSSFWNIETSGQKTSPTGIGLTTAQMQTTATYLDAGWDFVGETANGTEDLWWIDEGQDYPRLWWQAVQE